MHPTRFDGFEMGNEHSPKIVFFSDRLQFKVSIEMADSVEERHALVSGYLREFPLLRKLFILFKQILFLANLFGKEEVRK